MQFDFAKMKPSQCFEFMTGTVVPRPIALITTLAPDGHLNVAPYSFFNIMGIDPPVVAIGVLPTAEGLLKDTGSNIFATNEFVVNLVSESLAEAMNVTSIDAPPGIDEAKLASLETVRSVQVKPPRLAASPVSFECQFHWSVPLSSNQFIVIGRILQAHVADAFVLDAKRLVFDTPSLSLIGGMHGAKWYAKTTELFEMDRPSWAEWTRSGKT